MKLLVAVDLAVLLVVVVAFAALRSGGGAAGEENAVNEGLRGSLPPAGLSWPDLAGVEGIDPPVPATEALSGSAAMLVATCADCRSGDVMGGFLGRLAADDLPDGAHVHVVAWGGDVAAWAERMRIDRERMVVHDASDERAAEAVQRMLGIAPRAGQEESGAAMLYDTTGTWRSTFALGQLDRAGIAHDLARLGRE